MEMRGTQQEIWTWLARPGSDVVRMYETLKHIPSQLLAYQQAAVFVLAGHYKREGATFLDIGTGQGHSASIMALASPAPETRVITLTPDPREAELAAKFTAPLRTVEVWITTSASYLASYESFDEPQFDMVFIDGDHKHPERDIPWWEWIRPGGLMLFHDYSPEGAPSPSGRIVAAVDRFAIKLGRRPDVMIVDRSQTGMAGFYRR